MKNSYINAQYTFALGEMIFKVSIDDTLFAEYAAKNYPLNEKKSLRAHPLYEVFFVFEDGITVTYENGVREYKNGVLCIPPNKKHFTSRKSDYRLLFSYNITKNSSKDRMSNFYANIFAGNEVCWIPYIKHDVNIFLHELFFHSHNPQSNVLEEVLVSLLKVIFFHIYILPGAPYNDGKKYNDESRYIIIDRLINESTSQGKDISISTIAQNLHLSEKQTSKIIYKYYGKSLSEVVTEEKLAYAKYLLSATNIPISEIAYKCNFHSENYFYYSFKKKFGCTPLKYRKQQLKNLKIIP